MNKPIITILEINNNNYGSTGNIMINIANEARKEGFRVLMSSKNSLEGKKKNKDDQIFIGIWFERVLSNVLSYLTSLTDSFNIIGTLLFINKIKNIKPDIVHLHNMHGNYINISLFFRYLRKKRIPIVWTFHDNWPFTGHCATYGCNRWLTGCGDCPRLKVYPKVMLFDLSRYKWKKKKALFTGIENLTIITPSQWLGNMISNSFLKNKNCLLINNGIDLDVFHPTDSNFRKEHGINPEDYVVLGVANYWNYSKGIDVFEKISQILPEKYRIVLVGVDNETQRNLPSKIIAINHTYNQEQLVEIYSSSSVFVNPTRADNFPTVNIEALACGTPVITFRTGGSPEIVDDTCGKVIECDDVNSLITEIKRVCEEKPFARQNCINRAKEFDCKQKFQEYVKLYKSIVS